MSTTLHATSHRTLLLSLSLALAAAACTDPVDRDWALHPAVIDRATTAEMVVLGDVHGGYDRLVKLLTTGGLVRSEGAAPGGFAWTGGDRVLVCTGDVIDKGNRSLESIDLLVALEPQARAAGGDVIVTLGNHEAEFLAEPLGDKTATFRAELMARGQDPATVAKGQTTWGRWLVERPLAARLNGWFFSHAGHAGGRTLEALGREYTDAVSAGKWSTALLLADDSLLEARKWWDADPSPKTLIDGHLAALGARHLVFGHDPGAFGTRGEINQDKGGRLFLVDVGMSPAVDLSEGALLFITRQDGMDVASAMNAAGDRRTLIISSP